MSPDAQASSKLLYIVDESANATYVYSYPRTKLVGTLTGFNNPTGACAVGSSVWIANAGRIDLPRKGAPTSTGSVVGYAYGGSKPIQTLAERNGVAPTMCSYDKQSGNLAVAVIGLDANGVFDESGILLYKNGAGSPTKVKFSTSVLPYWLGYDNKGNIFVDGVNPYTNPLQFELFELPKAASALTQLQVNGATIHFPGGIQWDGKQMAIGDMAVGYAAIYQFTVSGTTATITGKTSLKASKNCTQYFIAGNKLIAPDTVSKNIKIYNYPAGGTPTQTITNPQFNVPGGAAIVSK